MFGELGVGAIPEGATAPSDTCGGGEGGSGGTSMMEMTVGLGSGVGCGMEGTVGG
jgi:hypothetical protein